MRESWTDERLDDGFDRVDADLRAVRSEIGSFRIETNERFDRFDDSFDRWQRLLFQFGGVLMAAMFGLVAATQL
jgi:hypothetical protein